MLEQMYEYPNATAWRNFQDEVVAQGFKLKLTDQVYDIYENGIVIYSMDKTTVTYTRRLYNDTNLVTPLRVAVLESIIGYFCGWGGDGLLKPEAKRNGWTLHNSSYPKLFTAKS